MQVTDEFKADFIYNSNGIEGLYTPFSYIMEYINGEHDPNPLVGNQLKAIDFVIEHRKEIPDLDSIAELHGILLKDIDSHAGIYRSGPVYIARQEAPDHKTIPYLLNNWCLLWTKKPKKSWTHKKAAMYRHFEYERIHPFYDGNGRSGRLLLLWDGFFHRTNVDIPKEVFTRRMHYYTSIQNYKDVEREELGEWV